MAIVLAGDVGGTKSNLAFYRADPGFTPLAMRSYKSREHRSLDDIVAHFIADSGQRAELACFGIAGPVKKGKSQATNLPWIIEASVLSKALGAPVWLINDLEANAYGVAALGAEDLFTLQAGAPGAEGAQAVVAAGTGLGIAGLYWDGRRHHPFATEGGHVEFAPKGELQELLLHALAARFGRVSNERVLSGPGLFNIYQVLRDAGRGAEEAWLKEEIAAGDPPAAVSRAGLTGRSPLAALALDTFATIYGAVAGDAALMFLATGGVYLGGGIAPKILEELKQPGFLAAFHDKGRMRPVVEAIPVRVILNDKTALLGAARAATLLEAS